ncbi:hypothetical protein UFOVP665_59 [uncultured Caudovirales phage]|uniref:Uncharacterized protein n=1 Tax=uncultured Caudovirales phage TaxID=2100421 RepID=A0A6J5NC23_9CAUD|nr:hypothetical protein UFOVP665_59 [uncultured Caudovirales phage]
MNIKEAQALLLEANVANGWNSFRTVKISAYNGGGNYIPILLDKKEVQVRGTYGARARYRSINVFVCRTLTIDAENGLYTVSDSTTMIPITELTERGTVADEVKWATKRVQDATYKADVKARVMGVADDAEFEERWAARKQVVESVREALGLDAKVDMNFSDYDYAPHGTREGVTITLSFAQIDALLNMKVGA